jgi:DNA-binding LacI/PurR family transcriptional regulator
VAEPGVAVTLRYVAKHAGVSRQTVSNVLNAPDRVDPVTRAKVEAAIMALGYQPNRTARNLATRQAGLIGYCLARRPGHNPFMDTFLHALSTAVEVAGRHVLLFTAPEDLDDTRVYADLVAQRAVDAFVLSDTVDNDPRHTWLADHEIAFASFGRTWPEQGEQPGSWVDVDGAGSCAELVAGLHALGHSRIAFIGWRAHTGAVLDRQRGWRSECERLGLPHGDELAVHADSDCLDCGASAAAGLLDSGHAPTAFVVASDLLAVGVVREVKRRGLRLGHEIAVTGFDDSVLATSVDGGLTTVRQPIEEVAGTLVELLATPWEARGVLLRGELVSRGSAPLQV